LKERPTIQKFIDYLDRQQITKTYEYLADRDEYLPWIAASFPDANLLDRVAAAIATAEQAELVKSKFNGERLMQLLPHLVGKELGHFIVLFKQQFLDFDEFIVSTEQSAIDRAILTFDRTRLNDKL
jgi:hypothetical protein